jgi:hypothetical protein
MNIWRYDFAEPFITEFVVMFKEYDKVHTPVIPYQVAAELIRELSC